MDKQQWKRISQIFDVALSLPKEHRTTYIRELCADDQELQKEIDQLLESLVESEGMLDDQLQKNEMLIDRFKTHLDNTIPKTDDYLKGHTIGNWKLTELLGYGGMGSVYKANRIDPDIHQSGALKIMHQNLKTPANVGRFRLEQQILASLHHPNIASLIDGGVNENGLPWMVMEHIEGEPLLQYCKKYNLCIRQRLNLFKTICDTVEYAHKNLIVHRDLKPENIFVTDQGHIKILDFGIAKLLNRDLYDFQVTQTQQGIHLMSLDYASPEQVSGQKVTTSTDLYALGTLLYELLAGTHPFDFESKEYQEIVQTIREMTPPAPSKRLTELNNHSSCIEISEARSVKPSHLIKNLRGDLDAIVLKALRKEPEERYDSVSKLKEDITFYLQNKPVSARGEAILYRMKKVLHRYKWTVAAAVAILISLIGGLGIAMWQSERARTALEETEIALNRTQAVQGFMLDLFRSAEPNRPRDQLPGTAEILELGAERALDPESAAPPERFAMLHTLADIYLTQNFLDQAQPLINEAVYLAMEHRLDRPEDFAKALQQQGWLAMRQRNFDTAEKHFKEAENWLAQFPEYANTALEIRANRGLLQVHKREIPKAIEILDPLYEKISAHPEYSNELRYEVINPLRIAYSINENIDLVQKMETELKPIVLDIQGPESLGYAIFLANAAGTKRELGHFDKAEADLNQAISLYNKIFDEEKPAEYRAAASHHLARVYLYRGEFDRAIKEFNKSNKEWANSSNVKPDDYPYTHLAQSRVLARAKRWNKSTEIANRALDTMRSDSSYLDSEAMAFAKALLSYSVCKQEENIVEQKRLENALDQSDELELNTAEYRAQLFEARAQCLFQLNQPKEALLQINRSLDAITAPGRVIEITDRRLLRSQILAKLGRNQEARQELQKAEQLFVDLGLTDHPHFSQIHSTQQELALN